jgi:BirA family transcriptional regulator, biotin operon repressor / biotin---[acetyl-CoA-carboxylase] ligase
LSDNADRLPDGDALARLLDLPRVVTFASVGSTLDEAHSLAAAGAASGTLVLAGAQTAGRGRHGRTWRSEPGAGLWITLVERPADLDALNVLSLRIGMALAPALDPFTSDSVRLKWPNDLYVGAKKLAGILVEARWRDSLPEWIAIGVGVNVRAPSIEPNAIGLRPGTSRLDVLGAIIPAIRRAAARTGALSDAERGAFAARDLAIGQRCAEPVSGTVQGIDSAGALLVQSAAGVVAVRAGSLVLTEAL